MSKRLEILLRLIKDSMSREAEPNGAITDTIWMQGGTETVFDALDRAIEQASSLLSRIEWLEAEKHSWKTYAKGLNSRIDALSKDADNLTKLLIEARDDVCECLNSDYLHAGWPRYDKRILFRHLHLSAIDAAISAREGE